MILCHYCGDFFVVTKETPVVGRAIRFGTFYRIVQHERCGATSTVTDDNTLEPMFAEFVRDPSWRFDSRE